MASEEKFCVVCGAGSHRDDWAKQTGPVACDSHSKDEVAAAVKAQAAKEAEAKKAAAAPVASAPSTPSAPPRPTT